MNPDYWQKQSKPLFENLIWNIPEQKQGTIALIGGNSQNFRTIERTASYIADKFPLKATEIILPDSLERKLPPLENIHFMPSTASGSFANSAQLTNYCSASVNTDAVILLGDFSKNSETATAVTTLIQNTSTPIYLTRDTIDLATDTATSWLEQTNINLIASLAQLQKLFKSVYFPKMLLLSQPLLPIVEALHKFTLSYPCCITTFHESQIITAANGQVITTPIKNTNYTPISLWSGTLTANIAVMNLYNPGKILEASVSGVGYGWRHLED
ncbi:hypothetical protein IJI91_02425 [Candidatus Saccharibacteria bacterium]|nr:hypothetical protein [Candidatus Saccharibacteria bacterium]